MGKLVCITQKGDFKKTTKFLDKVSKGKYIQGVLERYGQIGVDALSSATPRDTGLTAASWSYEVEYGEGGAKISWLNSNTRARGYVNIALILQYGHGTRNGGYVQGRDYINPAIQPVFDELADKIWKEVTSE